MSRYPLALLLGSALFAAEPPVSPTETAASATPAPPRAISTAMADTLKAALPKSAFVKPAPKKSDAELPDLRETDKPKNDIVRLPSYIVTEKRPPVFREQDIYTREAFARRLAKRYYSEGYIAFSRIVTTLTLGFVPISPDATAMQQFREEERLKDMKDFADRTNWILKTDPATSEKMRELGRDTFLHWSDFGWQGGKPK